jgi:hypothetical protein
MMKISSLFAAAALAVLASTAQAEPCVAGNINQSALTVVRDEMAVVGGLSVQDISGLLRCSPTATDGNTSTWSARDASMIRQIVVDFSGQGKAVRATLKSIPNVAGAGSDNSNAAAAAVLLGAAALAGSAGGSAGVAFGGCTPATINPSAIALLRPYEPLSAVTAQLGCAPSQVVVDVFDPLTEKVALSPGATGALWEVGPGGQLGAIGATFDVRGLVDAVYLSPGGVAGTYTGGFRQLTPPVPTPWQLSSGSVLLGK